MSNMGGNGPPFQQQNNNHYNQQQQGYAPQQQQQQQYQQRQPMNQNNHRGLGTQGAPQNLPPPSNLQNPNRAPFNPSNSIASNNAQVWGGEKFSLFVGGLPEGLEDGWLERILGTAGPVLSLRRPSPPFAFVEYSDAESVLRCLEVVNGTVVVGKGGASKALLIKADEKTRERLDQFEASRVKDESIAEFLLRAKDDLHSIVKLMETGDAPATSTFSNDTPISNGRERPASHLQDLEPEDLPVENRGIITSEIALFRESAAKKAAEKKRIEVENEARRNAARGAKQGPNGPGGLRPQSHQESSNGWGARGGQIDPQSYNKPVGFVASGAVSTQDGPNASGSKISDADAERARIEQVKKSAEAMLRDRERRLEARERTRISAVERERARERSILEQQDRDRVTMRERLTFWDDAKEADKGRELFYADRTRWRSQRRPFRARELESDAQDRNIEAQQLAALHKESEDFLDRQADMFAKITEGKLRANIGGLPSNTGEDESSIKLSFGAVVPKSTVIPVRVAVLGAGDEEDEGKKRRELIPLDYSDDEEEKERKGRLKVPVSRLSSSEQEKKKVEILHSIPTTKEAICSFEIEWSLLSEKLISGILRSFANKTIIEYLGTEEEELLAAVVEHLQAHKSAVDLVDELEPVLDEEATEFVLKVWKVLIYELEMIKAGL